MFVRSTDLSEKAAPDDVGIRKPVRFVTQAADLRFIGLAQFGLAPSQLEPAGAVGTPGATGKFIKAAKFGIF